jgi:hypothetical protein
VIRTRVNIADESGAEPIATGEVLEGSTLEGSSFCVGGTVLDTHGSSDPALFLIVETITCPEGTLSLAMTGEEAQGLTQTGTWMLAGGTGAYEGLHGTGDMEVTYDPDDDSLAHVTFTGTVTR